MFTPKGKFGWYELMTSDTKAAGKFYSDVVGWTANEMVGPDGTLQYTTFNIGEVGIAGMLNIPGHTGWVGYISVDDVDAHIEKIVEAGGKLWKPASDVPGMLRFAVMSDPQGAAIVVFTPNPAMPATQRPEPPAVGTIGWHELYTTDLDAGFDFYNKLFGWTKLTDMDMGPMGVYRLFDEGDHKEMGDGGMMTNTSGRSCLLLGLLLLCGLRRRSREAGRSWWRQGEQRPDAGAGRRLDHPGLGPAGRNVRTGKQRRVAAANAQPDQEGNRPGLVLIPGLAA